MYVFLCIVFTFHVLLWYCCVLFIVFLFFCCLAHWVIKEHTVVIWTLYFSLFRRAVFIEIEDLLQNFSEPNVMNIKMGTRLTHLWILS